MKFKLGQIVKHKLNNQRIVIVRAYPKQWYRKNIKYICSYGELPKSLCEKGSHDYCYYYEEELEEVSSNGDNNQEMEE